MATKPTAWGSAHVFISKNPITDSTTFPDVSTDFEHVGILLSDSLTIETTDGDNSELKDVNGVLIDKLTKEPTYTLGFKIIKPTNTDYTKFWDTVDSTLPSGESTISAISVKSFVCSNNYAIMMANTDSIGSDVIAIGKCSFTAKLTWSATEGYGVECSAEYLKTDGNVIMNIFQLDEATQTILKGLIG